MMKFTEVIKQYSAEKKARGFTPIVNSREIAKIRKLYKEGKFDDCEDENCEDKDCEMSESQKRQYERTLKEFRNYKESKGLGRGVSTKQKKMIERTILAGTLTSPVEIKSSIDEKTYVMGPSAKVTEGVKRELRSKILEARKNIFKAKMLLKENDMMGAADATQAAGDAVNAADATMTDPAAQGAVPQNIVDTVASLQTTVNDLATQCGIQSPVDVGADPNAGVPAVDGAAPAEGQQPVMEGLSSTKARLAKREALLRAIKEGTAPVDGQDAMVQEMDAITNPRQFHNIDKTDSEELVKPTTKKSKEAANTWPTVKATVKESKTEEMISNRIKENEDNWSFNRILKEGILG